MTKQEQQSQPFDIHAYMAHAEAENANVRGLSTRDYDQNHAPLQRRAQRQAVVVEMEDSQGQRMNVMPADVALWRGRGWHVVPCLMSPCNVPKPDATIVERARARAIVKAADADQAELADRLIGDGTPEFEALRALAADRRRRNR